MKDTYDNIVQFGLPRSGSTLICQVLSGLFPYCKVQKVHNFINTKYPIVISIRDFRDSMVSRWRVRNDIPLKELDAGRKMSAKEVVEWLSFIDVNITDLDKMAKSGRNVVLRYEEFLNNHDHIFNELEGFFGKSFDDKIKRNIKNNSSIEKNMERSMKFSSFHNGNWDSNGIHGLHIYRGGKVGIWRELVPDKYHDIVNEKMREHLIRWGYEV